MEENLNADQRLIHDGQQEDGDSSEDDGPFYECVDNINDLNIDTFSRIGIEKNSKNNYFDTILNRIGLMRGNEQQQIERDTFKNLMDVQEHIGLLEEEFRNEKLEIKESVENISSKNEQMATTLDSLEEQIQALQLSMEVHLDKELQNILEQKIREKEERWNLSRQMEEQRHLLETLKHKSRFRKDKFNEYMKDIQMAKDKEVDALKRQLRQAIEDAKQRIAMSEHILVRDIAELTTEKNQLEKERSELERKLRNADANKRSLENRIEFLNEEVAKRDECILKLETRLIKTKDTMRHLDELSANDYETFRRIVHEWQENDGRLNVESEQIKQRFHQYKEVKHQGDGQSMENTLTWVQREIATFQRGCVHETQLQRITDEINNALLRIRTDTQH